MTKLTKTFVIGGCGVHNPTHVLEPLGFLPYTIGKLGFSQSPYCLTSGAAVQLYDFCIGERKLPEHILKWAYDTKNEPTAEKRHLVDESELGFIELSTPVEPMIGNDIVNFNIVGDFVIRPLRLAGAKSNLLSGWVQSLINVRDDLKERADALLADWPEPLPEDDERRRWTRPGSPYPVPRSEDPDVRFAVEALRSRRLDVDDMVRDLAILREKMRTPMALKLFDFRHMPDGRAIDWPAGFKAQQREVARRLDIPTLDFAAIVERYGAANILVNDSGDANYLAHHVPKVIPLLAELMYDFWADILDRPYLENYPEWLEAKRELFKDLPQLFEGPARLAFPTLARFPETIPA